jgi:hypothetical protein
MRRPCVPTIGLGATLVCTAFNQRRASVGTAPEVPYVASPPTASHESAGELHSREQWKVERSTTETNSVDAVETG